jgi:hypothetical protein
MSVLVALALEVAAEESCPMRQASAAVDAADDILTWRYDEPAPRWRIVKLARLIVQREQKQALSQPSEPLLL